MQSSIVSGGKTHIQYEHFRYPRLIDVECPYCSGGSWLTHKTAPPSIESFLDIDFQDLIWNFTCYNCLKRGQYTWQESKSLKLFFRVELGKETVWGWNRRHFQFLISVFSKTNTSDDPWVYFLPYINKRWLIKIKKIADIKKLQNRLKEGPF